MFQLISCLKDNTCRDLLDVRMPGNHPLIALSNLYTFKPCLQSKSKSSALCRPKSQVTGASWRRAHMSPLTQYTLPTQHSWPEHIPPSTQIRLQTKWLGSMKDRMSILKSVLDRRAKVVRRLNMDFWGGRDEVYQACQNSQVRKEVRQLCNNYLMLLCYCLLFLCVCGGGCQESPGKTGMGLKKKRLNKSRIRMNVVKWYLMTMIKTDTSATRCRPTHEC